MRCVFPIYIIYAETALHVCLSKNSNLYHILRICCFKTVNLKAGLNFCAATAIFLKGEGILCTLRKLFLLDCTVFSIPVCIE
jgi:hypothetical protein